MEKNLFLIVNLLNRGSSFITADNEKRVQLLTMNLKAGKKAMKSSGFGPAATYLNICMSLLGDDHWHNEATLSLDVFSTLAKAEFCNGNLKEMEKCLDEIFEQNLPIKEKIDAYSVRIHSFYFLKGEPVNAVDEGLEALSRLGVNFPKKISKLVHAREIIKTKYMMKGLCIMSLSDHPTMEDENRRIVMNMMEMLLVMTYVSNQALFVLITLKMAQWSICYGVSKHSSMAFACYGVLLCNGMGDAAGGTKFGKVAMSILERFNAKDMESKVTFVYSSFISAWAEPGYLTHKHFCRGYEVGMQTGDINWAMLNLKCSNDMAVYTGKPLSYIEKECKSCIELMLEYEQKTTINWLLPILQFVLNLMGCSNDPSVLSGSVMQQEDLLKHCNENEDRNLRNMITLYRLWAAFYFEEFDLAAMLVQDIQDMSKSNRAPNTIWRCALLE
eukprot:15366936-Ditylum_brightwellii.AAC.1